MIGSYYCYDNPSALQDQLRTQFHNPSDFDLYFNLLYTVYSIPNVVLPFFGGYFVDWFGARWMNVIFSSFITLGQLVFAFGDHIESFPVMLTGRVLFGFGGESLSVGCSTIIADWFIGRELAFALGVNISIARIGSVVNDIASPALYNAFGKSVPYTLYFGVGICVSSTLAALCVVPLDRKAEERLVKMGHKSKKTGVDREEQIHLRDVKEFQLSFWLLTISCVVIYGCVLPWNNIAQNLIIQKFICHGPCPCDGQPAKTCTSQLDAEHKASFVMGIPYTMSAILSPFLGGAIDKVGGRAILSMVSSIALIAVHSSISLMRDADLNDLYAPLVFQGLSYAVFAAALWPSVPYVVKRHQTGTAYGIMTAIQNGGLALFPVIIGAISSHTNNDYSKVEWFFVGLAVLGLATAITLNIVDYRNGSVLNLPHLDAPAAEGSEKQALLSDPTADPLAVVTPELNNRKSSMDVEANDGSRVRFNTPSSPEISHPNRRD